MTDNDTNTKQVEDTGHSWDGIRELDNPCPRWWLISLYLSGLFVLIYFILYPSIPLIEDSNTGLLGWTQMKEYKEEVAEIRQHRAVYEDKLATMSLEEIMADPQMLNYVNASSKVLFGDNCAACHGVGGHPQPGSTYPILADDDWLYGGTVDDIMMSIANGRQGAMPSHQGLVTDEELDLLTQFVMQSPEGEVSEAARSVYMEQGCYVCHGEDAKGMKDVGSSNLTDKLWLFDGSEQGIRYTILHGVNDPADPKTRLALMPAMNQKLARILEARQQALAAGDDSGLINWDEVLNGDESERLTETDIKKLTIYVHQLGGGQ